MDKFLKGFNARKMRKKSIEVQEREQFGRQCGTKYPTMRKLGLGIVWDCFEKSQDGKKAKCRFCRRSYKTSGNTSNLLDHLKRAHPSYSDLINNNEKMLDRALMQMIALNVQPFSIVEDAGFRNLLYRLDSQYVLPSRMSYRRGIRCRTCI
ncbi:uncharacterized protein LOC111078995 isoform X1 [Drosophila obscura]|uniref:uncharacterized protein LOC111078995 isoform X1 n=1 Tax=Drosophila obscura TaxID=7282 RepID=UPI000BA05CB4|nr:uncharacterized protein LOC111078995 isoform X1 [Drosophila obscura]